MIANCLSIHWLEKNGLDDRKITLYYFFLFRITFFCHCGTCVRGVINRGNVRVLTDGHMPTALGTRPHRTCMICNIKTAEYSQQWGRDEYELHDLLHPETHTHKQQQNTKTQQDAQARRYGKPLLSCLKIWFVPKSPIPVDILHTYWQ